MSRDEAPPSGQKPAGGLARDEVESLAEELVAYHRRFGDLFARREQREWSEFYLRGQVSDLERKTAEPMVLALKGADRSSVRTLQQFLSIGAWADEPILRRLESLIAEDLGEANGAVIVDGSGFPKQGTHSVGVARQYCGHLGKVANCQHATFALYSSANGHAFLDRRLYMPEKWFDAEHAPLRERYGVPEDLEFTTEPQLALQMIEGLAERGEVPFRWVLGDDTYGSDPGFTAGVAALGKWYFVEVPSTTLVWPASIAIDAPGKLPRGGPRRFARAAAGAAPREQVRQVAERVAASGWRRYGIKRGAKGAIEAEFAFERVRRSYGRGKVGEAATLVLRRGLEEGAKVQCYLTNAPDEITQADLAQVSGKRWPIETAFEEAKGEVGMDHYEVRTWRGWHHHMTQTFLAHYFLVRLRLREKKSGADAPPDEGSAGRRARGHDADARASHRDRPVSTGPKLRRVSITLDSYRRSAPAFQKPA